MQKTHLIAKRFHQDEGFDYGENFSSMVKPTTVHMFPLLPTPLVSPLDS